MTERSVSPPEAGRKRPADTPAARPAPTAAAGRRAGDTIVISGEVKASEDLTIEGRVEGTIELTGHALTVGPNAKTHAVVKARSIVVWGELEGDVTASESLDVRATASVKGDVVSPRLAVADGARILGHLDIHRAERTGTGSQTGKEGEGKARVRAARRP
jgi:cytoskeletal protein CcmA (bactofilin family)